MNYAIGSRMKLKKKQNVRKEIASLARGPKRAAKQFNGYVINGYKFHTKHRDDKCTTQNSGVYLTALTTSFASAKDQKPTVGEVTYFGSIDEIIEVDYWGCFSVVLFKCSWYVDDKDGLGFTRVNFNRSCHKNDPFVLASQVHQVFYIQDPIEKHIHYPIKKLSTTIDDLHDDNNANDDDDINGQFAHDRSMSLLENQDDEASWFRDDVPTKQIPIEELKS